jgi:hypothetical protein
MSDKLRKVTWLYRIYARLRWGIKIPKWAKYHSKLKEPFTLAKQLPESNQSTS